MEPLNSLSNRRCKAHTAGLSASQGTGCHVCDYHGARKLEETYELNDLVIYNDESGGSYKGHIVAHWYEYTLRVVDRFGNLDAKFPELPSVRSKKQFQKGATVSIGLAYGDLSPTIIEEVIL
ncbi:MAG: carbamoyl-phosphate synthase subunit L [Anaerotruncus massiliensis (ex Togo et al. 2019)]